MGYRMRAGVAVIATLCMGSEAFAAPAMCARVNEVAAIQAAAIQQELMVAALTCDEVDRFNAFQTGFSSELRASDAVLERMFQRIAGARGGEAQYHSFKTRLANNASIRSIRDNTGFCHEARLAFASALVTEKPTLVDFVSGVQVTEESPVGSCEMHVASGYVGTKASPNVVPQPNSERVAADAPQDAGDMARPTPN